MDYSNFLVQLDKTRNKEIYAKVIALTFAETPIETIEGRITAGSINVDGNSAVRRTCSLTVVADKFNYSNYVWGSNTKFKLEIGVKNTIDITYPDIIWFKQGVFVLTSFNISRNTTQFTINLSGKDKMCLLNGECGGTFESSVDLGCIEQETKTGMWVKTQLPVKDIIRNAVHVYGGEPYHNIIINDLDTYGVELLEYRFDTPMYLWRAATGDKALIYENAMLENDDVDLYTESGGSYTKIKMSELRSSHLESLVTTLSNSNETCKPVYTKSGNTYTPWYFTKITYGQTAGYRHTDITYAGDLIVKVGENLVSALDKIKNMLAEFEYFYNLEGQFVFQKKQSYISTMWTPTTDTNNSELEEAPIELQIASTIAYTLSGGELITAFNNQPNISNLKNDYSVWGERTTTSGAKIPVHIRYAIDEKPTQYTSIYVENNNEDIILYNQQYETSLSGQQTQITYVAGPSYKRLSDTKIQCDWREIIYQMAADYYKYNHLDDFEIRVANANPQYPTGRTGYENYYVDIQGFWRDLYKPSVLDDFQDVALTWESQDKFIKALQEEIYGSDVAWSENKLGGVENDLAGLNNLLNENYTKAQQIVHYWNTGENKPNDISSMHAYKLVLLDKLTYSQNNYYIKTNGNYTLCSDKVFDPNKIYYRKTPCLYDFRDKNNNLLEDPDLYFGALSDYYFRLTSSLNTKLEQFNEIDAKKTQLDNDTKNNYYIGDESVDGYKINESQLYWRRDVYEAPDHLNFWFDFLTGSGTLSQFSVSNIGARSKAIQDSNVKSIYFRETPSVVFRSPNDCIYEKITLNRDTYRPNTYFCLSEDYAVYVLCSDPQYDANKTYYLKTYEQTTGFKYIQVPSIDTMFTISSQGKSAKERLDELLYQHSYCIETATVTTIPIYYLQPNQRIKIYDNAARLDGDYIVNKITIPLAYNGTMSLSVTKAVENLM